MLADVRQAQPLIDIGARLLADSAMGHTPNVPRTPYLVRVLKKVLWLRAGRHAVSCRNLQQRYNTPSKRSKAKARNPKKDVTLAPFVTAEDYTKNSIAHAFYVDSRLEASS